jgi:hypothetical protein
VTRIDAALAAEQEVRSAAEKPTVEDCAVASPSLGIRRQGSLRRKAGMHNLTPNRGRSGSRSSSSSLTAGLAGASLEVGYGKEKDSGGFGRAFQFQLANAGDGDDADRVGIKEKAAVKTGETAKHPGQIRGEQDVVFKLGATETKDGKKDADVEEADRSGADSEVLE